MPTDRQPPDDPSSAPESGTNRDETTGTGTADPDRRGGDTKRDGDDPSRANEQK